MGESQNSFKRREMKYLLSAKQFSNLISAISGRVESDTYGKYPISNLYMDTPDSRLIRKSMEKPDYKEKMRIRSYGAVGKEQNVFVELKKKYQGTVYKRRIEMPREKAMSFVLGKWRSEDQIGREMSYFIDFYKELSPQMYISYEREAFRSIENNEIRITFDRNIFWRKKDLSLGSKAYGFSVLGNNEILMEIKCADAMPLWLCRALTESEIYKISFSKYGKAYSQMAGFSQKKASGY